MASRILVLGNGWLGKRIAKAFDAQCLPDNFRLTTGTEIPEFLWKHFDVLINCIGKTNIDWCENNKRECFNVNTIIANNLSALCKANGKKYVYISSACVFESKNKEDKKFEDSPVNPQCFYSKTKAMAEELILETNPDSLIVRIRLPISSQPHPRNTITKLLSYKNVNTSQETVTVVEDMIPILSQLIREKKSGIFHLVNAGTISPAEIVEMFNHIYSTWTKKEQDLILAKQGRAKRVTAIVGSKKVPTLSNIRSRIKDIVAEYKKNNK